MKTYQVLKFYMMGCNTDVVRDKLNVLAADGYRVIAVTSYAAPAGTMIYTMEKESPQ